MHIEIHVIQDMAFLHLNDANGLIDALNDVVDDLPFFEELQKETGGPLLKGLKEFEVVVDSDVLKDLSFVMPNEFLVNFGVYFLALQAQLVYYVLKVVGFNFVLLQLYKTGLHLLGFSGVHGLLEGSILILIFLLSLKQLGAGFSLGQNLPHEILAIIFVEDFLD